MQTLLVLKLQFESEAGEKPVDGHDKFIAMAADEGMEVKPIVLPGKLGERYDEKRLLAQIESAQGFWVLSPHLLHDAAVRSAFEGRLADGAIAFARLLWGARGADDYFQTLGLEATSIRALRSNLIANPNVPPTLIEIQRETYPFGFRDSALFQGVDTMLLNGADGVGCFGDAHPVLALPSSEIRLLETRSDLYVSSFPRPEFPVIATASKKHWRGRVIASHVGLICDPAESQSEYTFPGIEAADNQRFAQNLLLAIASGKAPKTLTWDDVFALISEIETDMARTTEVVLRKQAGEAWFDRLVPEPTRLDCIKRAASEKSGFPDQAYLNLISFKKIWKANWTFFEPLVKRVSSSASKTASLRFVQDVNEIRNTSMHASKRYFGRVSAPSQDVLDSLRHWRDHVKELSRIAGI